MCPWKPLWDLECGPSCLVCQGQASHLHRYHSSTNKEYQVFAMLDLLRAARLKHGSAAGLDAAWRRALGQPHEPASRQIRART